MGHIPNIDDLISDTQKLRIQYEYTHKQCVGVAIEGMDIWYTDLIICVKEAKCRTMMWPALPYHEVLLTN